MRKLLLASGVAMLVCAVGLVAAVSVCAGRERTPSPSDCIIVLGARVRPDGSMSRSLRYRCERALTLWREGLAPEIICCGGRGADEPAAEGDVMRAYFLAQGVPEERVRAETESVNTIGNFVNARGIMESRGWRTAVVVTSDYHVERALWIAADAGIEAVGAAAPSPEGFWPGAMARLRESASWVLYGARRVMGKSA